MFCRKCGKEIPGNVKFCNYCGAPQSADDSPAAYQREPQSSGDLKKILRKKRASVVLKIFAGIACMIAVLALFVGWKYWNDFFRVPEKEWKEAEELYESGDYYAAYQAFWKASPSRAKYHKYRDKDARELTSLLKYCSTLNEGDDFLDGHSKEWHVMKKTEDRIILGLNQPTYESEENDPAYPEFYEFPTWQYWEAAILPVDGGAVFRMADELALETFGTTATEAAEAKYEDEWTENPDAQWFYPMLMLDLSFPKDDPFWDSVMYGARLNLDTLEFVYGPLQMTMKAPYTKYMPQINYYHLEETYREITEEDAAAELEEAGAVDVAVIYLGTVKQADDRTMVEILLADYNLSDGVTQGTCRFRCWDTNDPQSVLEISWNVADAESYEKVVEIMSTMKLADKPATEYEGYSYLGYRTHIRSVSEGIDNPISHSYDKIRERGSRY